MLDEQMKEYLIKKIKESLGIKSPSQETIRQWELWQTLTFEEKEKIIKQEEDFYNEMEQKRINGNNRKNSRT